MAETSALVLKESAMDVSSATGAGDRCAVQEHWDPSGLRTEDAAAASSCCMEVGTAEPCIDYAEGHVAMAHC